MLFEQRQPFVPVGETLVLNELAKEDIAPDRAQAERNWVQDQPEDKVL